MAKRRKHEEHPNHERWMVSYADFVTLMFALFVAMYAIALKDHTSGKRVAESVRQAVATGGLASTVRVFLAKDPSAKNGASAGTAKKDIQTAKGDPPAPPVPKVDPSLLEPFRRLKEQLKKQVDAGAIGLHLEARGLVITLEEKAFFASGDDDIYPQAYPSIERVASIVGELPNAVRLEGHTDSIPIHTARFKNNWELSTARSIALLQLFETKYGLDPKRFAVAGYAQNLPIASNDTEEGRTRNRRVEIVILGRQNAPTTEATGSH
ncbi:MAG: OmpA family protein [Acidobacteriaceae bacterium]|nr:OmpA family protein [Acidobacteriaceae bacterium]